MLTNKHIPYACQNISQQDIDAVAKALSQPIITRGFLVESFEKAMASYCGAAYSVAFNSGTAALMAAYFAADIGPYDRILTTPNTFVSTVGAAVQRSATPVFLDIDRKTGNFNLEQLSYNINNPSSRGKTVVVPVHFSGIPVDMKALDNLIANPTTVVIEDAAHALGSSYKEGNKVGCCEWSDMTIFSFHPAKTITTGEGGMVMTNDENLFHRLQLFRNNGIEKDPAYLSKEPSPGFYEVTALSGNYNFTEMQAALGLSQLQRLDKFIHKRQSLLQLYKKKLAAFKNIQLIHSDEVFVAPHLCVVQIDFNAYRTTRSDVMNALSEKGITTQVHYIPIYRHPVFVNSVGDISDYFPEMETYYSQTLSLPLFFDLSEEDVNYVILSLKEVLN